MPLMPAWDVDLCVQETERAAGLGLRGVNMTSDPQDLGSPDLANRAWDPFWEVCADLHLPVHFHIGVEPHRDGLLRQVLLGVAGRVRQARDRRRAAVHRQRPRRDQHDLRRACSTASPSCKMVSVESGIGWIPFILETHRLRAGRRTRPSRRRQLSKLPSEYFKQQLVRHVLVRATRATSQGLHRHGRRGQHPVRDRLPAPDVPLPRPARDGEREDGPLRPESRRKVMGDNAVELYRL